MLSKITSRLKLLGPIEKLFLTLLFLYVVLTLAAPGNILVPSTQIAVMFFAGWIAVRLARIAMRRALWRLRNRLVMTYLFIAAVPALLTITLVAAGVYYFERQLAVYLVTSELDRRVANLSWLAQSLAAAGAEQRREMASHFADALQGRFQNASIIVRDSAGVRIWPSNRSIAPPAAGWTNVSGTAFQDGRFYIWAHAVAKDGDITIAVPLTRLYLSDLSAGLGDVSIFMLMPDPDELRAIQQHRDLPTNRLGPPASWADADFFAGSPLLPFAYWNVPGKIATKGLISIHTRPSALLSTIINTKIELQQFFLITLLGLAILFAILEAVSLIKGITLARTITGAVHDLYEGTQRVMQGDFSHRIHVSDNRDQLAELSLSFNSMTGNIERLLAVSKEKERLQAEIEIAREVQEQLYPKVIPELRTLQLTAVCEPARMVSGDYYDFQCVDDGHLILAIGDVAGKGISAALLMATIQSAMRMELRGIVGKAAPSGQTVQRLSAARVVTDLNQQLHATTSPEKFATFCFGIYDEGSGVFRYTNAGHLPPILVRNGASARLDVNGMVVGAFPFARYEESQVRLESGDLLVLFTDGITEPENEYGEMFGEERLIGLITRNADRSGREIIATVIDAVRSWTNSPELQDDMTLLIARRV